MNETITLQLTPGQLQLLADLTYEAAGQYSGQPASVAALRAIDLWQHLDEALHEWETEEERCG